MTTILLFGNTFQHRFAAELQLLIDLLLRRNARVVVERHFHDYLLSGLGLDLGRLQPVDACQMQGDVALSIGGDGTFLRTARVLARSDVPVLGINTGHLGYLADASTDDLERVIDELFAGHYKIGRRTMLEVFTDGGPEIINPLALNEVAILRQDNCSMLSVRTWVNGSELTTYRGDGLIISTPTGSTAYNLSVGGPLIEPTAQVIALSPISAHSLTMRPLVLRDESVVTAQTISRTGQYLVSLDGEAYAFPSQSVLTVKRSGTFVKVIEPINHNFSDTLRKKLMWGQ